MSEEQTTEKLLPSNEEEQDKNIPEIRYVRAKTSRRLFANLVDLLIFALIGVLLFIGVRAIVEATPGYTEKFDRMTEIRLDSSLYVEDEGQILDVGGYLSAESTYTTLQRRNEAERHIDEFIEYAYAVEGEGLRDEIQDSYDEFRLSQTYLNKPLFIQTDEGIVDNPDCSADYQRYFDQVYKPFIDEYCQGFLTTRIVEYVDLNLYLSRILVFVEVPIAYCVSGILTYYIPNLIFKRGRKTFGKAIYKIGLVDSRLLNPTWQRSLARFSIFYFAILLLSVVTFAVPAIISTTLMGFSKKKQGFADYILDLQEIDTSGATIFYDLEEAAVSVVDTHKKPIDFESIVRE